ncbi:MAG TPA: trypsin-like peptidase domain-containing protein [Actinomycetota bacterium]
MSDPNPNPFAQPGVEAGLAPEEPDAPTEAPEDAARPAPEDSSFFWEAPSVQARPARRGPGILRASLAWFIAALLGASGGAGAMYLALTDRGAGRVQVNVAEPPVTPVTGPENAAARVASAVLPSIVQITVASDVGTGLGSGVIYSPDGFVLTNNHVVCEPRLLDGSCPRSEIEVLLPSGEVLPAAVVGTAIETGVDIAVLKVVSDEPLPAATFGSSKDLVVGELAVAIGNPFGLESTVTAGIISGLHRNESLNGGVRFTDAIQTDAPINQGNSGGALANSRGEVIGINTAIVGGQGNVGVGFAIPIDIARKVADQMIDGREAQLAYLGISGGDLIGGAGARVAEVERDGPAARAGIEVGDVVVEFDGREVDSMDALISLIIDKDVGDVVTVVVEREGETVTTEATLAPRPAP